MKTSDEMAESVLSRRNEYVKMRRKRVRTIASSAFCLALIAGVGFGLGAGRELPGTPDVTAPTVTEAADVSYYVNMENIHVNDLSPSGSASLACDQDCLYVAGKSKLDGLSRLMDDTEEEKFLRRIGISLSDFIVKLPKGYELSQISSLYVADRPGSGEYNVFHDYLFFLSNTQTDGSIKIAMSPVEKPLRDCFFMCDDPVYSEINGVKLVITGDGGFYCTVFEYNGIWYDVETDGASLEDFVILLYSIIT